MALSPGALANSPQVNFNLPSNYDDRAIVFNHAHQNLSRRNETVELSTTVALSPGALANSPHVNFNLPSNYDVPAMASDNEDSVFDGTGMVPLGFGLPSPSK